MSDSEHTRRYRADELDDVVDWLMARAGHCKVWLFTGEPGAGKTTLIRELAARLGADPAQVSSPTFSIQNVYPCDSGVIHHFDLYRLRNGRELLDIGMDEYLAGGDWCLVEWPGLVLELAPPEYLDIRILHPSTLDSGHRDISVSRVTN